MGGSSAMVMRIEQGGRAQPGPSIPVPWTDGFGRAPERRRVVGDVQVGQFVQDDVIAHGRRELDESPVE